MPLPRRFAPPLTAQLLLLAGLAAVGAALAHRFAANPLALDTAWSTYVEDQAMAGGMASASLAEAQAIVASFSHLVLDARRTGDYDAGRLPGALSLPVTDFDAHFPSIAAFLTPEQPVLVYCSGADCDESLELGRLLQAAGFTNLTLFVGGMAAWTEAGLEVER